MAGLEVLEAYFQSLEKLASGDRAALKHSAGTALEKASGKAMSAFYRVIPKSISTFDENAFYAVGCISCMWKEPKVGQPMEMCLKMIGTNGVKRRVIALLDGEWTSDGSMSLKVLRLAKLLLLKGYQPNFPLLLKDMLDWNHPNRFAQKKWARVYFGGALLDSKIEEEKDNVI